MEIEVILTLIFGAFVSVITLFQVIIPIVLGRPMFPSFRQAVHRKSIAELKEELRVADEELQKVKLQHEIERKKAEAFKLSIDLMMPDPGHLSEPEQKSISKKSMPSRDQNQSV